MDSRKYLVSESRLKALQNAAPQMATNEIDLLWSKLASVKGKSYVKILADSNMPSLCVARELETRWYAQTGMTLSVIVAPLPPVASYLRIIRKIDFGALDYLFVITAPDVWAVLVKRLSMEPGWDMNKLIFSSNLLNQHVKDLIGVQFYM